MKKFFVYIIIFAISLEIGSTLIIGANYLINFDYISKVLCINQDKPELECHGKCHLAKEIKKDSERKTEKINSEQEEVYFIQDNYSFAFEKSVLTESVENFASYQFNIIESFQTDIFHPPIV